MPPILTGDVHGDRARKNKKCGDRSGSKESEEKREEGRGEEEEEEEVGRFGWLPWR